MINPPDLALTQSLTRLRVAYDRLLSANTRATMPLPSKMPIAVEMADKLAPVLSDIYWHPLRNGVDEAPEGDKELRSWLKQKLSSVTVWAAALALLGRFYIRSVNYGGSVALDVLGLAGNFSISNNDYLNLLSDRADMLTTDDSDMSLVDTTIDDLSIAIPNARNADGNTLALLGGYIADRALTRGSGIATYEAPWGFNSGLTWTYKENGVRQVMYDVNGIGCPEICEPLHGTIMPIDDIPYGLNPPLHSGCDCIISALTDDWTPPDETWTGE